MKLKAEKMNNSIYPNKDDFNKKIKTISKWTMTSTIIYGFTMLNDCFARQLVALAGLPMAINPVYQVLSISECVLFLCSIAVPLYSIVSLIHYKVKMKSSEDYNEEKYRKLKKKYVIVSLVIILLFIILFVLTKYFVPEYI